MNNEALRRRVAVLASMTLILSGCAGLPSVQGATDISLAIGGVPPGGPRASVTGESDAGPGKAAKAVLPPAEMCQDIMVIVCVVFIPIVVPSAAIYGAIAKATQKLPLDHVSALNRSTENVVNQLNLGTSFSTAMAEEGQRRGITLSTANSDVRVVALVRSLSWNIKTGNRVALRMEIDVTVQADGERGSKRLTYRGASASVDSWTANDGEAIRAALHAGMIDASRQVWERILGAERGGN